MAGGADDSEANGQADPLVREIGLRLRDARTGRRRSLSEIAVTAGITKDYLWRVENGRQAVTVRTLARIAQSLGTTMADLLSGLEVDAHGRFEAPGREDGG